MHLGGWEFTGPSLIDINGPYQYFLKIESSGSIYKIEGEYGKTFEVFRWDQSISKYVKLKFGGLRRNSAEYDDLELISRLASQAFGLRE